LPSFDLIGEIAEAGGLEVVRAEIDRLSPADFDAASAADE